MKKLNIAILGTGSIASGGHAPALLQSKHAQLWSVTKPRFGSSA